MQKGKNRFFLITAGSKQSLRRACRRVLDYWGALDDHRGEIAGPSWVIVCILNRLIDLEADEATEEAAAEAAIEAISYLRRLGLESIVDASRSDLVEKQYHEKNWRAVNPP